MTDSALDTTAPSAADPVAAPAPVDAATTLPSDAPTAEQPAEDPVEAAKRKTTEKWLAAETAWKTAFDKDWKYERYEFHGDLLAVRIPKQGALLAVSMGGAKYGSTDGGLGAMNQFCNLHLGPESRQRVLDRMMNPDETAYGDSPMGDLFTALGKLSPE
jgi:hypothetical protein